MNLIDCDVHPRWRHIDELAAHLDQPWRSYLRRGRVVHPHNGYPNPIATARRDATPPAGGSPGSDPRFTVEDHIERNGIDYAVLIGEPGQLTIANMANAEAAAALAAAYNDWLAEQWLAVDRRYLGSIYVAPQAPDLAAREIDRAAADPRMVQVILGAGSRAPYGQRQFHPIYAAAERHDLPIAIHIGTEGAGTVYAPTAVGHPSHYVEWHVCHAHSLQAHLASFLFEGVFERFPRLRLVLVEGGVAWLPAMLWRMDQVWKALRSEIPWVRRRPSEYVLEHVRVTTQPLEEPENPRDLVRLLELFPAEQLLMFSSDYPHWDTDNPARILMQASPELRRRVFVENARELYRLPRQPISLAAAS